MGEFFMQIRFNNDAAFFNEHRGEYERWVRDPLYALADALAPAVLAIDPEMETRPARVVSRIRRDTRFTRDKSPYRSHMWIGWSPVRAIDSRRKQQVPGLYFGVHHDHWSVGAGYYEAMPATMKAYRARMLAAPSSFMSIVREPGFARAFSLDGEDYKRPPVGIDDLPDALRPWYAKKSFSADHTAPVDERTTTAAFAEDVAALLGLLGSLYTYLSTLPIPD
jgi:uncharacterized protein (TIGR02453 family)